MCLITYLSFIQQGILSKQILGETPTELRYFVFMKEMNNPILLNCELGSQENINVPNDYYWIPRRR